MKITLIELEHLVSLGHIPKINTITGYEDITDTYRKVEFGLHIKFNDGSELKCATNHLMLHNTEWIKAESCYIGMVFSDKTIVDILMLPKQEWVDFTVNAYHHSYIHNDITHHNSGKSHVIYLLIRFLLQHLERDILICVPTTALCSQIIDDFDDYVADNWIAYDNCHKIYSGQDKTSNKRVVVSTYQSLVKMSAAYFNKFDALIVDEAHQADSKSIISIIDNMAHAPWRFGLTGTLNGTKIHELCLRGLFGPTIKTKSTKDLMDDGVLSKLKIEAYKLKYSPDTRKLVRKHHSEYQTEIKWLLENVNRNSFIINKAFETTKNTLILFNMEEHGKELLRIANGLNANGTKQIFFMNGKVKTDEREEIRKNLELINDAILIASYGVFSIGANVKNIDFVMFAHPYKARIRNLQSIGRSIRKKDGKDFATLIDIGDDLTQNKKPNITYTHFTSRLKIYTAEQFEYVIKEIDM